MARVLLIFKRCQTPFKLASVGCIYSHNFCFLVDDINFKSTSHILSLQIYISFNYNTITIYILIIYELINFDHVLGEVSKIRVSGGNRTHYPHANSQALNPLDYQGTKHIYMIV